MDVKVIAKKAKEASYELATRSTGEKNAVLRKMAELIVKHKKKIINANKKDIARGKKQGLPQNLLRRLVFDEDKILSRFISLKKIAELPDPVGQMDRLVKRPNGLLVGKMRVPLGVIMMIYEARPHVTINAGAFCLKSANAAILKGGKEAEACNAVIGELWGEALQSTGLPTDAIQCVTATHEEIAGLLELDRYIDLVIPRGGKKLIEAVVEQARMPVIKHYEGICHVYIDDSADKKEAIDITLNSKLLMPEVCNAAETLLISEGAPDLAKDLIKALRKEKVEIRACPKTRKIAAKLKEAKEEDWRTEYLDKIMSVKIVPGIEGAIKHINKYGSGHTDTIVTENYTNANRFLREVDSGVVLVNASTMFDDGEELGMGAEIGISTDKLHARGPMGLNELTTYKFTVFGEGHIKE